MGSRLVFHILPLFFFFLFSIIIFLIPLVHVCVCRLALQCCQSFSCTYTFHKKKKRKKKKNLEKHFMLELGIYYCALLCYCYLREINTFSIKFYLITYVSEIFFIFHAKPLKNFTAMLIDFISLQIILISNFLCLFYLRYIVLISLPAFTYFQSRLLSRLIKNNKKVRSALYVNQFNKFCAAFSYMCVFYCLFQRYFLYSHSQ
jgi:hypothetical protein